MVQALLAASLVVNVLLGEKVRELHKQVAASQKPWLMDVGFKVPSFDVLDATGAAVKIEYGSDVRPTLLYTFHPDCGWCNRNWANVQALHEQAGDDYRILVVSRTSEAPKNYAEANRVALPIYHGTSEEFASTFGLRGTPQTIIVSSKGRVLKNWVGAYSDGLQEEIERDLGVRLPGVSTGAGR
jgi:hypothetical protein